MADDSKTSWQRAFHKVALLNDTTTRISGSVLKGGSGSQGSTLGEKWNEYWLSKERCPYDNSILPVVEVTIRLKRILALDFKEQSFEADVLIFYDWIDPSVNVDSAHDFSAANHFNPILALENGMPDRLSFRGEKGEWETIMALADVKKDGSKYTLQTTVVRHLNSALWNMVFAVACVYLTSMTAFASTVPEFDSRMSITVTLLLATMSLKWVISDALPGVSELTTMDKYVVLSVMLLISQSLVFAAEKFAWLEAGCPSSIPSGDGHIITTLKEIMFSKHDSGKCTGSDKPASTCITVCSTILKLDAIFFLANLIFLFVVHFVWLLSCYYALRLKKEALYDGRITTLWSPSEDVGTKKAPVPCRVVCR